AGRVAGDRDRGMAGADTVEGPHGEVERFGQLRLGCQRIVEGKGRSTRAGRDLADQTDVGRCAAYAVTAAVQEQQGAIWCRVGGAHPDAGCRVVGDVLHGHVSGYRGAADEPVVDTARVTLLRQPEPTELGSQSTLGGDVVIVDGDERHYCSLPAMES